MVNERVFELNRFLQSRKLRYFITLLGTVVTVFIWFQLANTKTDNRPIMQMVTNLVAEADSQSRSFQHPLLEPSLSNVIVAQTAKDVANEDNRSDINRGEDKAQKDQYTLIPTGIFIQSVALHSANKVELSGYVWQANLVNDALPAAELKGKIEPRLTFPEALALNWSLVYPSVNSEEMISGWYFNAVLRQAFDYADYPFDQQIVSIRLWPKYSKQNELLIPMLSSYPSTRPEDVFGLEQQLVLPSWKILQTFFEYETKNYSHTFGASKESPANSVELSFNILLSRDSMEELLRHLVPIFTMLLLCYLALLAQLGKTFSKRLNWFNKTGQPSIIAFYLVALGVFHWRSRNLFAGQGMVYIDWLYWLVYLVGMGILFLQIKKHPLLQIDYRLNPLLKLYWPTLSLAVALSAIVLLP